MEERGIETRRSFGEKIWEWLDKPLVPFSMTMAKLLSAMFCISILFTGFMSVQEVKTAWQFEISDPLDQIEKSTENREEMIWNFSAIREALEVRGLVRGMSREGGSAIICPSSNGLASTSYFLKGRYISFLIGGYYSGLYELAGDCIKTLSEPLPSPEIMSLSDFLANPPGPYHVDERVLKVQAAVRKFHRPSIVPFAVLTMGIVPLLLSAWIVGLVIIYSGQSRQG